MEDGSFDIKRAVLFAVHSPSDQRNLSEAQFQAMNSPGVDTAACIEISFFSGTCKTRSVGMAADNHGIVFRAPSGIDLFYFPAALPVSGRACRVTYAKGMHESPKKADSDVGNNG